MSHVRFLAALLSASMGQQPAPPSDASVGPGPTPAVQAVLDAMPAHGNRAQLGLQDGGLWIAACGTGFLVPSTDAERRMPEALQRARAVRAAVIDAKAAVAACINSNVSTVAELKGDESPALRSEIVTRVQRQALCALRLNRASVHPEDGGFRARVLLFADVMARPDAVTAGMPRFDGPDAAAETIARWVGEGLCTDGAVRVFVGPPDRCELRTFGVGLVATDVGGSRAAEVLARAGLLADGPSEVSGRDVLRRESSSTDPLSREGSANLLRQEFFRQRTSLKSGLVREAGHVTRSRSDGLTICVMWGETGSAEVP